MNKKTTLKRSVRLLTLVLLSTLCLSSTVYMRSHLGNALNAFGSRGTNAELLFSDTEHFRAALAKARASYEALNAACAGNTELANHPLMQAFNKLYASINPASLKQHTAAYFQDDSAAFEKELLAHITSVDDVITPEIASHMITANAIMRHLCTPKLYKKASLLTRGKDALGRWNPVTLFGAAAVLGATLYTAKRAGRSVSNYMIEFVYEEKGELHTYTTNIEKLTTTPFKPFHSAMVERAALFRDALPKESQAVVLSAYDQALSEINPHESAVAILIACAALTQDMSDTQLQAYQKKIAALEDTKGAQRRRQAKHFPEHCFGILRRSLSLLRKELKLHRNAHDHKITHSRFGSKRKKFKAIQETLLPAIYRHFNLVTTSLTGIGAERLNKLMQAEREFVTLIIGHLDATAGGHAYITIQELQKYAQGTEKYNAITDTDDHMPSGDNKKRKAKFRKRIDGILKRYVTRRSAPTQSGGDEEAKVGTGSHTPLQASEILDALATGQAKAQHLLEVQQAVYDEISATQASRELDKLLGKPSQKGGDNTSPVSSASTALSSEEEYDLFIDNAVVHLLSNEELAKLDIRRGSRMVPKSSPHGSSLDAMLAPLSDEQLRALDIGHGRWHKR